MIKEALYKAIFFCCYDQNNEENEKSAVAGC